MSINLEEYLKSLKDEPTEVDEFPPDYQDTYDLGIKHGRIVLARQLWKLLLFDVEM